MKQTLLAICLLAALSAGAQVPEDAIRYSYFPQNGSARNLAIGGAMGSLGGDISANFVNPAGLGFYNTRELVLTPGFMFGKNTASFRGNSSNTNNSNFRFGSSGIVIGFGNNEKKNSGSTFSLAINQTANFNSHIQYKGLNNYSSFAEQFAEEFAKSGYTIDEVLNTNSPFPYSSAPALYTYLIDTVTIGGITQVKAAPEYILDAGQAIMQEMDKTTRGSMSELALSFAHHKNEKWFWGLSIGVPFIYYDSKTQYKEYDTSSNNSNHFKQFDYSDNFTTSGIGFNARLGVIYRPVDYVRLGLSVQTPSFMSLTDKRTTTFSTQLENPVGNFSTSSQTFTNNQPGESRYNQNTPFKAVLSASYVFREVANTKRQRAFLTADVEYVHHRGSRFSSNNDEPTDAEKKYYKALTSTVKDIYKGNFNFRVGGELKFNVFMIRAGFGYYTNPYKDAALKASRMLLSGGLGYRNKGMFIDLSYVHSINKDVNFPYRLEDRANTYATTKQVTGNVVATVGFKF